uniref:Uncharacterized protein n=1 Tax=Morchella brunnea TaxID=1174671 RepID=A0A8K1I7W4_9PEZI|nr:hypothetical protein LK370_mgp127 [Morchella brunnea]UBU98533.1 hypothetical protein [Morchella brunnea]
MPLICPPPLLIFFNNKIKIIKKTEKLMTSQRGAFSPALRGLFERGRPAPPRPAPSTYYVSGWPSPGERGGAERHTTCVGGKRKMEPWPSPGERGEAALHVSLCRTMWWSLHRGYLFTINGLHLSCIEI